MYVLQTDRPTSFLVVAFMGVASAFVFWMAGECVTWLLPQAWRESTAKSLTVPGLVAGFAFELLHGPAFQLYRPGESLWWRSAVSEHVVLWAIAGGGGLAVLGTLLERLQQDSTVPPQPRKSLWAVGAVVLGLAGTLITIAYQWRSAIPLDNPSSVTPASVASTTDSV